MVSHQLDKFDRNDINGQPLVRAQEAGRARCSSSDRESKSERREHHSRL